MAFWPLLIGAGVAATVVGGRFAYTTFQRISSRAAAGGVEALTKKFYDGGFEPTMTRREAALLLGCRESSEKERVMQRYKKLMILNHPDRGGSPFLASKVNEAKDLLARGK